MPFRGKAFAFAARMRYRFRGADALSPSLTKNLFRDIILRHFSCIVLTQRDYPRYFYWSHANESLGDNRLNAPADMIYFTLDRRLILL